MFIRHIASLSCLFLLAVPTFAFPQADPPASPVSKIPNGWGVNIHFTDPGPGEMERFSEAGYQFVRMDFFWGRIEKKKGEYDWSPYDRLMGHLDKIKVHPIFILDYGNDVYEKGPPRSPEARAAFARFAAEAVKRYAGRGVVWEIWNEPNLAGFWPPKADATEYATLAVETAKAIRTADPKATLIAPGASGFPWEFFETVFQAGLLQYLDGVSLHPYRGQMPETAAEDYAKLRVLIARYAPKGKENLPIVSSEWGYSTVEGGVSEEKQAQYLTRMWLANLVSGVNLSIFYDWRDDGDNPKENEHRFGTVRRDLTPKPSFLAAQKLLVGLKGYTFRHRLQGKDSNDWRLLFQKGDSDSIALVTWNADPKAPAEEAMPTVRPVPAKDPQHKGLRRLASIRFPYGPIAVEAYNGPSHAWLKIAAVNIEDKPAVLIMHADLGNPAQPDDNSTIVFTPEKIAKGETASLDFPLRVQERRDKPGQIKVSYFWGGSRKAKNLDALPEIVPLVLPRTDALSLTSYPKGNVLEVEITNANRKLFKGVMKLLDEEDKELATKEVSLAEGWSVETITFSSPGKAPHRISLREDRTGKTGKVYLLGNINPPSAAEAMMWDFNHPEVARTELARYLPLEGFVDKSDAPSGLGRVLFIENVAQKTESLRSVVASEGSPAPVAVAFDYQFDKGWRYAQAMPEKTWAMPEGAKALVLWVNSPGTGDSLRSRFKDATGQTFQVDLGDLTWKGWRAVTISLDGTGKGAHWGGANTGIPQGRLQWEGMLLIDSTNRETPHGGTVFFAAPTYIIR